MDPTEPVVPPTTEGEIQQTPAIKLPKDQVPCKRCTSQEIALQRNCGFNHIDLPPSLCQIIEGGASAPPKSKQPMDQVRCGKCESLDAAQKRNCGFNHGHLPPSLGQTTDAVVPTVTEKKLEEHTPTKTGGGTVKKACRDFASSGICPRGAACNFSHVVVPSEPVAPIPEVKPEKKGGKGNNKPAIPIAAGGSMVSLEATGVKPRSEKDILTTLLAEILAEKSPEFVKSIMKSCVSNDIDVSSLLSKADLEKLIKLSFSVPKK
jgi:hypothetical protein